MVLLILAGYFDATHSGTPCSTWSTARFAPGGAVSLRTRLLPWGLPNLSQKNWTLLQSRNFMMRATFRVMQAMHGVGGQQTFEHPEDPGRDPFPSVWNTTGLMDIQRQCSLTRMNFSQRDFGAQAYKGTDVAGSSGFSLSLLDRPASRKSFKAVIGVDPTTND